MVNLLAAEGREGALVGSVDATTRTSTGSATRGRVTVASVATEATPEFATAAPAAVTPTVATGSVTTATSTTSSATSTPSTTVVLDGRVVLALQHNKILGLILLLALLLATGSGNEGLILGVALKCLALWEFLLRALVRLACLQLLAAESQTLLGKLSEILVVGLGNFLWLGWRRLLNLGRGGSWPVAESCVATRSVRGEASIFLDLGGCDGLTSLLVVQLGISSLGAPSLGSLLLVLANIGVTLTVVGSAPSATSEAPSSTIAARPTSALVVTAVLAWFYIC